MLLPSRSMTYALASHSAGSGHDNREKTKKEKCRRETWEDLLPLYHTLLSHQYGAIPEVNTNG
jgi:hypothetical protein